MFHTVIATTATTTTTFAVCLTRLFFLELVSVLRHFQYK